MCLTHLLGKLGRIGGPLYKLVDRKLKRAGDNICLELIVLPVLIHHEYKRMDMIFGIVSHIVRQFILLLVL